MCTSLLYLDAKNRAYVGRTLELSLELPYLLARFPKNTSLNSTVEGYPPVSWETKYAMLAVTMPSSAPTPHEMPGVQQLKIIEGLNEAGLSFSVQSYSQAGGPQPELSQQKAALSAMDLGSYLLGQYATVAEVKEALSNLQIVVERVPILGGLPMPFHYAVHDASGASLVIEFHRGERSVYDNPVGVMTNAPQFSWHLTNLNNYTYLSNVDRSRARFLNFDAVQPGAGISKAGLPPSDSSVDRFIRAVYYAQFAEKQTDADKAVQMVAHIMNNFDRPRGIAIDPPQEGSEHLHVQGLAMDSIPTEFTSWTSITDIDRRRFYLRDSRGMNYVCLDLSELSAASQFAVVPMNQLSAPVTDVSKQLA